MTGTARTGTEQLLLTNAWDKALEKVDFRPLTGVPVFLDTANVTAVDQGWVVSSLREAMLTQGVLIREKREQAQFIVEARVGAYGTDDDSFLVGISQTTIPPTVTGVPTGTIPELPLIKRSRQQAVAKLALFAYDRASGQLVWRRGRCSTRPTPRTSSSAASARSSRARSRTGPRSPGSRSPCPARPSRPRRPTGQGPPPEGPRPTTRRRCRPRRTSRTSTRSSPERSSPPASIRAIWTTDFATMPRMHQACPSSSPATAAAPAAGS